MPRVTKGDVMRMPRHVPPRAVRYEGPALAYVSRMKPASCSSISSSLERFLAYSTSDLRPSRRSTRLSARFLSRSPRAASDARVGSRPARRESTSLPSDSSHLYCN